MSVLDRCADQYTFPMLDNGYFYLAASRLGAYADENDWALVVEVFGFSPRAEVPHTFIYSFGSSLRGRPKKANYATPEAYQKYIANNPFNESHSVYPFDDHQWIDDEDGETVDPRAEFATLRGRRITIPGVAEYEALGIELEEPGAASVFEFCRAIAATNRDLVLATPDERRAKVPDTLTELLSLDEWNHPDVVDPESRPSGNETFRQLASVLMNRDPNLYSPSEPPNTHWKNWPDGGTL